MGNCAYIAETVQPNESCIWVAARSLGPCISLCGLGIEKSMMVPGSNVPGSLVLVAFARYLRVTTGPHAPVPRG